MKVSRNGAALSRRVRIVIMLFSLLPFYMAIHLGLYLFPLWVRGVRVEGTVVAVHRYVNHHTHSNGIYYTWTPVVKYTGPNGLRWTMAENQGETKYTVGEKVTVLMDPTDTGPHNTATIDTPFNDWGKVVIYLGVGAFFIVFYFFP